VYLVKHIIATVDVAKSGVPGILLKVFLIFSVIKKLKGWCILLTDIFSKGQ